MANVAEASGGASKGSTGNTGKQLWPPHRVQLGQMAMYALRRHIREWSETREAPKVALAKVEKGLLGEGLKSVVNEALQSKAPEDGQNLLTYAAAHGSDDWFLHIASEIRSRLGIQALVKELRELDHDGAPLLFNAAASRGKHSCFETARVLLHKALGYGGLMEQVEAVDLEERALLMYAARSNHIATFQTVFDLWKGMWKHDENRLKSSLSKPDKKGMSCVHHAAEAGSSEVLEAVISKLKKFKLDVHQALAEPNNKGRTPIMLVLRNEFGRMEESGCTNTGLNEKFSKLRELSSVASSSAHTQRQREGAIDELEQQDGHSDLAPSVTVSSSVTIGRGADVKTTELELQYAVRGGLASLELLLNNLDASEDEDTLKKTVGLGHALGTREDITSEAASYLLASAAKRGDVDVLYHVLLAIEDEKFTLTRGEETEAFKLSPRVNSQTKLPAGGEKVKNAVKKINDRHRSLFSYAIMSGIRIFVEAVHELVEAIFATETTTAWDILSGKNNMSSSLTCAASASMETPENGLTMFNLVNGLLEQHPENKHHQALLLPSTPKPSIPPLVGAALSSNWVLFWRVHEVFEKANKGPWARDKVWIEDSGQFLDALIDIADGPVGVGRHTDHHGIPGLVLHGAGTIPAVMWRDIFEALTKGTDDNEPALKSWRQHFIKYSERAVYLASERGNFTDLRDLVKEGFPLHDDYIPDLLEYIGDHEQDIIETILFAVANASNPFGMGAGVSKKLKQAGVDHPMYKRGLRRLQQRIDEFNEEVAKSVHSVHVILTANLLDELPHTVQGVGLALRGIRDLDSLHQKDRDREGYLAGFIAVQWMLEPSALVESILEGNDKGYVGPRYKDPLKSALDRGSDALDFLSSPLVLDYVHLKFSGTLPAWTSRGGAFQSNVNEGLYNFDLSPEPRSFLLRFLQGWDHQGAEGTIPHSTILPGLQFSLAGILGKPETFYQVPVIRFVYEIFGYLGMLGLFCSSVMLKEHNSVPPYEFIFYIFAAGLLWREVLEFVDGIPDPAKKRERVNSPGFNRIVSAFTRYVFYDTWNFLDMSTILCLLVAFVFRMMARNNEFFLFHAQFFYALSAPLLFSRLLVLSQIDATLGPMTQVIWRMMSHTLRFSAFIAMVMLSFALAFYAVFHTCDTCIDPEEVCDSADDEAFPLRHAFGTFGASLLTLFDSALGGHNFSLFDGAGEACDLPENTRMAGYSLMVVYLVTMSVVLLNLLIAVLSTAHDKVYDNSEKEFHLARARLVVQSAKSVLHSRPPPPLNLIKVILGFIVDLGTEGLRFMLWLRCKDARTEKELPPFSTTSQWKAWEGFLQRGAFALTMGVAALALSTVLWIVSIPWVAWCLLRQFAEHGKAALWIRSGYVHELLLVLFRLVALGFSTVFASLLCVFFIGSSILLWIVGVVMLFPWLCSKHWGGGSDKKGIPEAMAGLEGGKLWQRAWTLAKKGNHGIRRGCDHPNFYVVPFLKSKTGLDIQHLARMTTFKDERSASHKQLVEVDRELGNAAIDLRFYLSQKPVT